jgi:predicted branched-subunit amino acid permease
MSADDRSADARSTASRSTTRAARAGVISALPFVVGLAPFALVIGAAAAEQGSPWAGWTGSFLIYGGSAHLATLRSVDAGVMVAVATGLLVNARIVLYSAALSQRWREQPVWFRAVAAAMVVDPTFAIADRHASTGASPRDQRSYFLASGVTLGVAWSALIAIGAIAGARADGIDLDVAVPVCMTALLGPALRRSADRVAAVAAATAMVFTSAWPANTGLVVAVVAGTLAGAAATLADGAAEPARAERAEDERAEEQQAGDEQADGERELVTT